jgi:hypothetical protein
MTLFLLKVMKTKQAFDTLNVTKLFHSYLFIGSCFFFYKFGKIGWLTGKYSWRCEAIDRSLLKDALEVIIISKL